MSNQEYDLKLIYVVTRFSCLVSSNWHQSNFWKSVRNYVMHWNSTVRLCPFCCDCAESIVQLLVSAWWLCLSTLEIFVLSSKS